MRQATLNASVRPLAPKAPAISASRISPVTREASVNTETVDAALSRFIGRADYRQRPLAHPASDAPRCILVGFARGPSMRPLRSFIQHSNTMATATKAKKKTVRLASGRKRARQDVTLNAHNTALRSRFRTVIKNVQKAVAGGDKAKATEL